MSAKEETAKPSSKKPAAKPAAKAGGYVVAKGKAITVAGPLGAGMICTEGDKVAADAVADIEALVKGGYVTKA